MMSAADNSSNQKFVEIWGKLWANKKQKLQGLGLQDKQMWGREHFSAPAFLFSPVSFRDQMYVLL